MISPPYTVSKEIWNINKKSRDAISEYSEGMFINKYIIMSLAFILTMNTYFILYNEILTDIKTVK